MKKLNEKQIKIIISVIIIIIILIIALLTVKTVNNNIKTKNNLASNTNPVGITGIEIDKSETSDGTYQISDGGQSASFTATLGKPGDAITYIISVKNNTYEPATIIKSVDITKNENDALRYTTDGKEKVISKGETKKIKFTIAYDSNTTDVDVTSSQVTVKFNFAQHGLTYGDTVIYPVNGTQESLKLSGLYYDTTQNNRYFYSGSNPNNDIVFNGEPYRILGFEPDGRIKIIKMVSLGNMKWNTINNNVWETSSLKQYLEETWLPTQESEEDYKNLSNNNEWYAGAVSNNSDFTEAYSEEKKTTVSSPVGLISVSEYLKSRYANGTFLNTSSSFYFWALSPCGTYSNGAWHASAGYLNRNNVSTYSYGVFPVLYLKSSVSLTGSGTSSDPYCVAGSNCPTNLNFSQRAS